LHDGPEALAVDPDDVRRVLAGWGRDGLQLEAILVTRPVSQPIGSTRRPVEYIKQP